MLKSTFLLLFPFFFAQADHSQKIGAEMVVQAQKLISDGVAVVDVRQEACRGHVKGATLISIDDILAGSPEALSKIDVLSAHKSKPIAFYCYSGGRAGKVISYLRSRGYTDIHNLGGVGEYFNAGSMQSCN